LLHVRKPDLLPDAHTTYNICPRISPILRGWHATAERIEDRTLLGPKAIVDVHARTKGCNALRLHSATGCLNNYFHFGATSYGFGPGRRIATWTGSFQRHGATGCLARRVANFVRIRECVGLHTKQHCFPIIRERFVPGKTAKTAYRLMGNSAIFVLRL